MEREGRERERERGGVGEGRERGQLSGWLDGWLTGFVSVFICLRMSLFVLSTGQTVHGIFRLSITLLGFYTFII